MEKQILDVLLSNGIVDEGKTNFKIIKDGKEYDIIKILAENLSKEIPPNIAADVKKFCTIAGQPTPTSVKEISDDRKEFRIGLIKEEVAELELALSNNDEIEERDAIIDTIYVLLGLATERGYLSSLYTDWETVQKANMSKFCESEELAKFTVSHYKRQNTDCYYEQIGAYWVVKRKDGKVLKSNRWEAPIHKKL